MKSNEEFALEVLGEVGAVITDSHIVYASGLHGSAYVNKDSVFPHIWKTSQLCKKLSTEFLYDHVEAVIGPTIGGVIMSQWTTMHLSDIMRKEVLAVYAERIGDEFVIKRGYDELIAGKNVLVVEDVLTTGETAKKVVEAVRAVGGKVIGLGALCNRGGVTEDQLANVPKLVSMVNINLKAWSEADCPLCASGVPINTKVGKGLEYLARMAQA
jgi:orotate phosphoribosyltransferase